MRKKEEQIGEPEKKESFVIHIQTCRNATWQGKVIWTKKKKEEHFRSELELIHLLNSAIENDAQSE